jgi:hypothetical protein
MMQRNLRARRRAIDAPGGSRRGFRRSNAAMKTDEHADKFLRFCKPSMRRPVEFMAYYLVVTAA